MNMSTSYNALFIMNECMTVNDGEFPQRGR